MKNTKENDEALKLQIKELLSLGIGISIEVAGSLYIRDLDNGDFAVGGDVHKEKNKFEEWEESFTDLDDAIKFFINKRNNGKIGDDFWFVEEN